MIVAGCYESPLLDVASYQRICSICVQLIAARGSQYALLCIHRRHPAHPAPAQRMSWQDAAFAQRKSSARSKNSAKALGKGYQMNIY